MICVANCFMRRQKRMDCPDDMCCESFYGKVKNEQQKIRPDKVYRAKGN